MELFKLGRKTYIAFPLKTPVSEAITRANEHFRTRTDLLDVHTGRKDKKGLWIYGRDGHLNNVLVVSRRTK